MSYTEKDYKKFVQLRDGCSLKGCGNYYRNIARLDMTEFLKKFGEKDQKKMFNRDDKEYEKEN